MVFKLSVKLEDFAGNFPQKRGRKPHPLKVKYKGQMVTKFPIGYIDPITKKVVYNELIDHPAVKRIMKRNGVGKYAKNTG